MRIITGSARGTKLKTLEGVATRPTAEIVKEAVFSMIQFELEGRRVLDLFSGSGQMALEALSRGARSATLIDSNPDAVKIIKENALKTKLFDKCVVLTADSMRVMKNLSGKEVFDIIFVDPPYADNKIDAVVECIIKYGLLAENGLIICEDDSKEPHLNNNLKLRKHSKYGRTYITVLENSKDELEDPDSTEEGI